VPVQASVAIRRRRKVFASAAGNSRARQHCRILRTAPLRNGALSAGPPAGFRASPPHKRPPWRSIGLI